MEPESPSHVPYTAYRSKRHSRNLSNNFAPRPSSLTISSPTSPPAHLPPTHSPHSPHSPSRIVSGPRSPGNEKASLFRELGPPSPPPRKSVNGHGINGHDAPASEPKPTPVAIVLPPSSPTRTDVNVNVEIITPPSAPTSSPPPPPPQPQPSPARIVDDSEEEEKVNGAVERESLKNGKEPLLGAVNDTALSDSPKSTITPTVIPIARSTSASTSTSASMSASSSMSAPAPAVQPRQSTFRRITPARTLGTRSPLAPSPLRPSDSPNTSAGTHSRNVSSASTSSVLSHVPHISRKTGENVTSRSRYDSLPALPGPGPPELARNSNQNHTHQSRSVSVSSTPAQSFATSPLPTPIHSPQARSSSLPGKSPAPVPVQTPTLTPTLTPRTTSPVPPPTPPKSPATSPTTTVMTMTTTNASTSLRVQAAQRAVYRPGFQPKGVYRPRTDEFLALRKHKLDVGRIERTKLERRFEKLIELHFPVGGKPVEQQQQQKQQPSRPGGTENRRQSFFDIDFEALRNVDAGGLLKGVWKQGEKGTIRAAEQRIAPWQEDSSVSKCPLCEASFHPITNRKHHCRLCGQIICSLPIRRPQRPTPCSMLFVVDSTSRRIEEVSEGVDYGVRRRRPGSIGGNEKVQDMWDEEKFLKGVRICRQCKPIMLRQQYRQDFHQVPVFTRLHDAFVSLEKEIEDSLPQFQELVLSLSQDDQPTKEATAARKRILEAFSQYDALSKRIRKLPCPSGPGSSQDRVLQAIQVRATLFLEKNMFPLQSLPTTRRKRASSKAAIPDPPAIDTDSELALTLQPLLEQEALLESFVEEANAHRKFEDAKTLKANLAEIRAEIKRIANEGNVR